MNTQRRTNRKGAKGIRHRLARNKRLASRRLFTERLEDRRLLTTFGDGYNPYHNYFVAADVNSDFYLSPSDALAVIRELNTNGARDLSTVDSSSAPTKKVDTNGDGLISPSDALGVINALNDAEGQQELLSITLELQYPDGTPLQPGDRVMSGQDFLLQAKVADERDDPTYVFSAYFDIDYDTQLMMNGSLVDVVPDYVNDPDTLTEAFTLGVTDPSQFTDPADFLSHWSPEDVYTNLVRAWPWRWDDSGTWTDVDGDKDVIDPSKNPGEPDYYPNVDQFDEVGAFADSAPDDGSVPTPLITATLTADLEDYDYPAMVTFAGSGADLPTSEVLLLDAPDGFPGSIPAENIIFNSVSVEIYKPLYVRDSAAVTQEDTPVSITPDAELDIDSTGTLSLLSATDGSFGTVDIVGGQLVYTPNLDYNIDFPPGTADTFTYTMSDGLNHTDTATVTVTVTPVNDKPNAGPDSASVAEDSGFTEIVVLDNDDPGPGTAIDETGQSLTLVSVGSASNGTARISTIDPNKVEYQPNPDFFGTDTFTYTVRDELGATDTATVTVQVTPVNDDPTAVDDTFPDPIFSDPTILEDSTVTLDVLRNDSIAPDTGEVLSILSAGVSTSGTAIDNPGVTDQGGTVTWNGVVTYTPRNNYSGTDSFSYVISDGNGGTDIATVTVEVAPVNDAPIPSLNEDFVARERLVPADPSTDLFILDGALPGPANDAHEQATQEVFVLEIVTAPTLGTMVISPNGKFVTYTPNVGNLGGQVDFFQYRIRDSHTPNPGESEVADGFILIDPAVRPYAIDDVAQTDEDQDVDIDVLANDLTDVAPTRFELVESIVGDTINGTNTLVLAQGTATIVGNMINFDPAPEFFTTNQPVSFQYVIDDDEVDPEDGPSEPSVATVLVTVNSVNDNPIAVDDGPITVQEDTPTSILSLTNDSAGPANETEEIFLDQASDPAHGTVEISADGKSFLYSPDPNFYGTDTFTYTIRDAFQATSNTATVDIVVENVNDAPTAVPTTFPGIAEDSTDNPLSVMIDDFVGVPMVPDGADFILIQSVGIPSEGGSATISPDETQVLYTPLPDFFGTETFTYTIVDSGGLTSESTVTVIVDNVNDPPMVLNEDGIDSDVLLALKDFSDQPLEVLANDSIFPDVGEVLTIKELIGQDSGGNEVRGDTVTTLHGSASISPDRTEVIYTPTPGFETVGSDFDTFGYVVTDGNEPNGEATGLALIDVIDAVPSEISGSVYIDANGDGIQQPGELTLAGVEVTLSGVNIRGVNVNQTVQTDANGVFTFAGVLPTLAENLIGYSITAQTPRYLNDGLDAIVDATADTDYDPGVATNDLFSGMFLGVWGANGRASHNYSFGESGLDASHIKLTQYLASYRRGALLAGDGMGDTFWWSMMEGWEGVTGMEFQFTSVPGVNDPDNSGLATAKLRVRDSQGTWQDWKDVNYYTHYDFAGDPRTGGCVIFLKGSAADMGFDLSSNDGGAEGEAPMEAAELELLAAGDGAQYRQGVDAVFGSGDWA